MLTDEVLWKVSLFPRRSRWILLWAAAFEMSAVALFKLSDRERDLDLGILILMETLPSLRSRPVRKARRSGAAFRTGGNPSNAALEKDGGRGVRLGSFVFRRVSGGLAFCEAASLGPGEPVLGCWFFDPVLFRYNSSGYELRESDLVGFCSCPATIFVFGLPPGMEP